MMNNHPACCLNPDTCTLSYREHLSGFSVASAATPNRRAESHANNTREGRWHRDMGAYKRLRENGLQPPQIDGSALREKQGTDRFDIEERPVTIDYSDSKK